MIVNEFRFVQRHHHHKIDFLAVADNLIGDVAQSDAIEVRGIMERLVKYFQVIFGDGSFAVNLLLFLEKLTIIDELIDEN